MLRSERKFLSRAHSRYCDFVSFLPLIASVAAPVIGGLFGSDAAQGAADTQAGAATQGAALQNQAANRAIDVSQQNFNTIRGDLAPFRDQGPMTLETLKRLLGTPGYNADAAIAGPGGESLYGPGSLLKPFGLSDFKESPAYQFNLQQGQQAIEKAARRSGKSYSPSTLQDIAKFSQGMASNEFNNAYNMHNNDMNNLWSRLFSMSGVGQAAANQTGAFGTTNASNIGNLGVGGANAMSAGITGAGAANAAGQVGSANALSGGLSSAYNNYLTQQLLSRNQTSSFDPNIGYDSAGGPAYG